MSKSKKIDKDSDVAEQEADVSTSQNTTVVNSGYGSKANTKKRSVTFKGRKRTVEYIDKAE